MSSTQSPQKNLLAPSDPQTLLRIRHTCAHILAMAVQNLFPETKVTIGPWTETGFYYDFARPTPFTPEDLEQIEAEMRRIVRTNLPIIREVVDRDDIQAEIAALQEPYKQEILDSIPVDEPITRYFIGSPDAGFASHPELEPSLIDRQRSYAIATARQLQEQGFRVEVDASGERLGKQIRTAELEKIPVTVVVGKREVEQQTLSVRSRQSGDLGVLTLEELQEKMQGAIADKSAF